MKTIQYCWHRYLNAKEGRYKRQWVLRYHVAVENWRARKLF